MIATDAACPAQGAQAAPGRRPLTFEEPLMRDASCLAATLLAACLSVGPLSARGLAGDGTGPVTRLSADGVRFTVNGRPPILCGVRYYGALGAPDETVRRDLADLKALRELVLAQQRQPRREGQAENAKGTLRLPAAGRSRAMAFSRDYHRPVLTS